MENYKLIKYLNEGSFGKIYLIERKDCKQQFAMKTIKITGIDRYQKLSILTEIKILLTSDNEFLLKCYDIFIHNHRLCIITEYVDGGDLDQYIKDSKKTLDSDEMLKIFLEICVGINALHVNQIIHRDIKPANILITKTGHIKICDFGICKYLDYNKVTNTMVGTPFFMSPEQMHNRYYDYKSDVWGIGCVLYFMMYKKYPFNGKSILELKRNIQTKEPVLGNKSYHGTLHSILNEMLNKNKSKRPDLKVFLENDSNDKLLHHYNISSRSSPFQKYNVKSIPIVERDWDKMLSKIRKDFFLPSSLYDRTAELLKDTQIPASPSIPKLVSYATIKQTRIKSPDIKPIALRVKIPPRPSVSRSSLARREAPRQISHRANPGIVRVPTPLYRPAENHRIKHLPCNAAMNKHKPMLNYLRNKKYPPKLYAKPLPRVNNRYKNIQSKVKQYWAPNQ